ncbi:Mor transcription activator family protein [Acinetobacter gerneri]|uniref:Mor transcription activator family protein n=1 Tax=Acinetobacter gerneri TaxID=202952 RepID=UPI0028A5E52F|nr:Mor transcription activator family protein [Acinetobacter gerneri]
MHEYPLPQNLIDIAETIGRSKAFHLVGQLPRTKQIKGDNRTRWRIYLHVPKPENLKAHNRLVKIIGWEDAYKMSLIFGGEVLSIPSCKQMQTHFLYKGIRAQYDAGVSIEILMIIFGMTRKNIQRILF